jgi:hypothetical protein
MNFVALQFGLDLTEEGAPYTKSLCDGRTSSSPEGLTVYAAVYFQSCILNDVGRPCGERSRDASGRPTSSSLPPFAPRTLGW